VDSREDSFASRRELSKDLTKLNPRRRDVQILFFFHHNSDRAKL